MSSGDITFSRLAVLESISVVTAYHIHKNYPDQLFRWLPKEKKLHSCRNKKHPHTLEVFPAGAHDPKP